MSGVCVVVSAAGPAYVIATRHEARHTWHARVNAGDIGKSDTSLAAAVDAAGGLPAGVALPTRPRAADRHRHLAPIRGEGAVEMGWGGDTCVRSLDTWETRSGLANGDHLFGGWYDLESVPASVPALTGAAGMFANTWSFRTSDLSGLDVLR